MNAWRSAVQAMKVFSGLSDWGLTALMAQLRMLPPEMLAALKRLPDLDQAQLLAFNFQPRALKTLYAEMKAMDASYEQVRASGNLGDLPLIVLKSGKNDQTPPKASPELIARISQCLRDAAEAMASLSSRGRLIEVADAGHAIQIECPNAVVEAIHEVLDQVEGRRPIPR